MWKGSQGILRGQDAYRGLFLHWLPFRIPLLNTLWSQIGRLFVLLQLHKS